MTAPPPAPRRVARTLDDWDRILQQDEEDEDLSDDVVRVLGCTDDVKLSEQILSGEENMRAGIDAEPDEAPKSEPSPKKSEPKSKPESKATKEQ